MPSRFRGLFKRKARNPEKNVPVHSVIAEAQNTANESQKHDTYFYNDIGEHQMRILVLAASTYELSCEIRTCAVSQELYHEEQSNYLALSYEWGTNTKSKQMQVYERDGKDCGTIAITQSLYDALCDIRDSGLANVYGGVFADQVCINQDNAYEVSIQVANMGRIYRQADKVVTYLGPKQEKDEAGFELIKLIYKYFEPHFYRIEKSWYRLNNVLEAQEQLKDLVLALDMRHPGWASLRDMMWSGWTQRLWMIPENTLHRVTSFLRGTEILVWKTVVVLHVLSELNLVKPTHLLHSPAGLKQSPTALSIWKARMYSIEQSRLCENIAAFSASSCSDARDRVYALLAISEDTIELELQPDYSEDMTVHRLYGDVAFTAATYYNDLSIMETAEQFPNTTDPIWESWLPDWRVERKKLSPFWYVHQERLDHKRAAPNFNLNWDKDNVQRVCIARGAIYDQIQTVLSENPIPDFASIARAESGSEKGFLNLKQSLEAAKSWLVPDHTIASTLTARANWPDESLMKDWDEQDAAYEAFMERCTYQHEHRSLPTATDQLRHIFLSQESERLSNWFVRRAICATNRRLCITAQRKQLCLAHPDTRVGDLIVTVFGARMSWILRPCGDALFRLVGMVHVDGYGAGHDAESPEKTSMFSIV